MKLRRPLAVIDIESATPKPSPDPACDKIVHLGAMIFPPHGGDNQVALWKFNPGMTMSKENIECHGITNDEAALYPKLYAADANEIKKLLTGCDLAGFNLSNYDIPLLWEEMFRVGVELDLDGVLVFDAGTIFKKKEERSLSAAVRFYLNREHLGAHSAMNDVSETADVLFEQVKRYADLALMTPEELAKFSQFDDRIDLAGKIVRGPDGQAVYNFGKSKGVRVLDDTGFGYWMLGKDFSENTKRHLSKILDSASRQTQKRLI